MPFISRAAPPSAACGEAGSAEAGVLSVSCGAPGDPSDCRGSSLVWRCFSRAERGQEGKRRATKTRGARRHGPSYLKEAAGRGAVAVAWGELASTFARD